MCIDRRYWQMIRKGACSCYSILNHKLSASPKPDLTEGAYNHLVLIRHPNHNHGFTGFESVFNLGGSITFIVFKTLNKAFEIQEQLYLANN